MISDKVIVDDRALISSLYRHLLGREPDREGLAWFLRVAERTGDFRQILLAILGSPEYQERVTPHVPELHVPPMSRPLIIVDVGAQKLVGEEHIYAPLVRSGIAYRCIGFEPLAHRRAEMQGSDPNLTLFPDFIGDGSEQRFYINNDDATSSLLPLNLPFNAAFNHLSTLRTVSEERVKTTKLDDVLSGVGAIDFLKLDIQGFELRALEGAEAVLRRTNVIHCEVEFAPIYRDQPMFSEVEAFLRAGGFEFIDFTASCRYTYEKTSSRRAERLGWADAVFFRSGAVGDNALAQAAIAAHVYGKHGLAEMVLTAA